MNSLCCVYLYFLPFIVSGGADGDVWKAAGGGVCFPTQGTIEGGVSREDAGSGHVVGLSAASYVI